MSSLVICEYSLLLVCQTD